MPCGRIVSLRVGGLDVKANFVPKIDIVRLVRIVLLDGRDPYFWRSFRCSSGAGWDKFGAVICSLNFLRLCLKLSHVFVVLLAPRLGSMRFPQSYLFWKWIRLSFLFWFELVQSRAGPWIIGINSFPFSGVAEACFQQALPVVGTVADVTDIHVFKGGERSGDSRPRW